MDSEGKEGTFPGVSDLANLTVGGYMSADIGRASQTVSLKQEHCYFSVRQPRHTHGQLTHGQLTQQAQLLALSLWGQKLGHSILRSSFCSSYYNPHSAGSEKMPPASWPWSPSTAPAWGRAWGFVGSGRTTPAKAPESCQFTLSAPSRAVSPQGSPERLLKS